MKQGRHPLVVGLLQAIGFAASLRAGLPLVLNPNEIGVDRVWTGPRTYPLPSRGNGSARVRRAALKRRNRAANRRAHRG